MGSSSNKVKVDNSGLCFKPVAIPLKAIAVWMYFICAIFVVVAFYRPAEQRTFVLALAAMSIFLIVPSMLGLLACINDQTGSEPYLIVDSKNNTVSFPRLNKQWSINQVRESEFVDAEEGI